jgi:ferredoxin-type protein NapF
LSVPTRRAFLTGRRAATPVTIGDHCLARCFVHCQSCGDVCAEQAIRFTPRFGGPPLPSIVAERCTGCGECAAACPADAITIKREMAHA